MLFLCQHIGEKLGDNCITKYGKTTTIRSVCYRCADNYLQKQYTRHLELQVYLLIFGFSRVSYVASTTFCQIKLNQIKNESLFRYVRVCEEFAQRNDLVILNTYIDRAMTGTNDNIIFHFVLLSSTFHGINRHKLLNLN